MVEFRNQTVTYLKRKFRDIGIRPVSKHGQNFLIDMNILDLLVRSAEIGPEDVVLEIGTGTGTLSTRLASQAAHLVTVEIDPHMVALAQEELDGFENVTLLQTDALRNKNHFQPILMETIRDVMERTGAKRYRLAANLPYNVATPILSNLLRAELTPASMTVTIQKEMADRLVAVPSTKDYGAISVWMQSQCDVELVRVMPPSVFWPKPKVDSAIVHLQLDPERRAGIPDLEFFHEFTRSVFFHRRKYLRSVLHSAFKNRLEKSEVDQVMRTHNIQEDARAETFSVEEIFQMGERFREALAQKGDIATP
ncbi:MAG: 16S rRNA (adenine(1518)-N(6)/adenine(1519)-N(6))-dimethyltransferase RsmA [Pirellulaceae bacterium]